jgi:hypothetical protein
MENAWALNSRERWQNLYARSNTSREYECFHTLYHEHQSSCLSVLHYTLTSSNSTKLGHALPSKHRSGIFSIWKALFIVHHLPHGLKHLVKSLKVAEHQWLMPQNPSYLGGWDQEDFSWRPTHTNSSWDSIFKITRAKWNGGVAQSVECLICKHKVLSTNSSATAKRLKF